MMKALATAILALALASPAYSAACDWDNGATLDLVDGSGNASLSETTTGLGRVEACATANDTAIGTNTTNISTNTTHSTVNGANCSAGSYPLGVDADKAAEGCTDASTEIDAAVAAHVETFAVTFSIEVPSTTATSVCHYAKAAITLTEVSAYTSASTQDVNANIKANPTTSPGTDALTTDLTATTTGAESTTFTDSSVAAGEYICAKAEGTLGANLTVVTVTGTMP